MRNVDADTAARNHPRLATWAMAQKVRIARMSTRGTESSTPGCDRHEKDASSVGGPAPSHMALQGCENDDHRQSERQSKRHSLGRGRVVRTSRQPGMKASRLCCPGEAAAVGYPSRAMSRYQSPSQRVQTSDSLTLLGKSTGFGWSQPWRAANTATNPANMVSNRPTTYAMSALATHPEFAHARKRRGHCVERCSCESYRCCSDPEKRRTTW